MHVKYLNIQFGNWSRTFLVKCPEKIITTANHHFDFSKHLQQHVFSVWSSGRCTFSHPDLRSGAVFPVVILMYASHSHVEVENLSAGLSERSEREGERLRETWTQFEPERRPLISHRWRDFVMVCQIFLLLSLQRQNYFNTQLLTSSSFMNNVCV